MLDATTDQEIFMLKIVRVKKFMVLIFCSFVWQEVAAEQADIKGLYNKVE